jgi:hypothetical protein
MNAHEIWGYVWLALMGLFTLAMFASCLSTPEPYVPHYLKDDNE